MEYLKKFFAKDIVKRVLVLIGLAVVLYFLRGMANIFLLTFIFTYVLYSTQAFIIRKLKKIIRIGQRVMILILYIALIFFIGFFIYQYIPILIDESKSIFKSARDYYINPSGNPIAEYIVSVIKDLNISNYVNGGINFLLTSVSSATKITFDLVFSLILSLFFLLERNRIVTFTENFKTSRISFI
jgi:predicted PurR-regulated permease PerM